MWLPSRLAALLSRVGRRFRRDEAGRHLRGAARSAPAAAPGTPPPVGESDPAFLSEVGETLLRISAGTPPGAGPPPPRRGMRDRLRRLAPSLEPLRRHEDGVLAVVLVAGIVLMILHWLR